jgi:hypothetical protein
MPRVGDHGAKGWCNWDGYTRLADLPMNACATVPCRSMSDWIRQESSNSSFLPVRLETDEVDDDLLESIVTFDDIHDCLFDVPSDHHLALIDELLRSAARIIRSLN